MRLPRDILLTGNYTRPRIFLCETNKDRICELQTTNTKASLKFNAYSELSFEVGRTYNDLMAGESRVNPHYDKIESPRIIEIENIGYFELQGPELTSDGIQEQKSCTAYSLEYTLSTKYLNDFIVNTGAIGSIEVTYAQDVAGNINDIVPVTLYNPSNPSLSLLHLVLNSVYGWSIGHVDPALRTLSRQFEIDRSSVYDFLINEVCQKFNCYIVFDTIENTINVYAESQTAKFIGDGETNTFIISPPFAQIGTVSVDGYKTTRWQYDLSTGAISLEDTPVSGAHIEVIDGALSEWETDVFVTFENLSQEINISYDSDSIKTQLTVTYGDDGDIREVNLGLPYLTDLSYYYTVDWMGQDLYDAYTKYLQKSNTQQIEYANNSQCILDLDAEINAIKTRLSLVYAMDSSVNPETIGTYYVISGGTYPNYTYNEVSLPSEYNANTVYYKMNGVNVTEEKVSELYSAIRKYFVETHQQKEPEIKDIATMDGTYEELMEDLTETNAFDFVASDFEALKSALTPSATAEEATVAVRRFLNIIWNELGLTPLETLFLMPYKAIQTANIEAGYSITSSPYYWFYYPVTIMIDSLNEAINERQSEIAPLEERLSDYRTKNAQIADSLLMVNNFTEGQLVRLSAFVREDELHIDDIVDTSLDTTTDSFKVKQDAMESGRIELNKICQPQLQFSMSMANIYALPEFAPIVDQFQLGKVIKVALRPDYIKQSRLLQVDIGLDDFSDFSCEFGELTSVRSQSDIHADLLSKAITAGKSVATNSSYWTRGADQATATDLKIQQGLLDANTQIKAMDGNQGVVIDKYGIHLTKINPATGEVDPHQAWITNNMILMSDDGFRTSRSALGEITIDGQSYYGIIAEAVLSGYIEGSKIVGGTIQIGERISDNVDEDDTVTDYIFEVDADGSVRMNSPTNIIIGYATEDKVNNIVSDVDGIALSVKDLKDDADTIHSDVAALTSEVNAKVSSESLTIEVNKIINNTGVGKVTTSKGFTFDDKGLTVSNSGNEMTTTISEDGMTVYKNDKEMLTANSGGVSAVDLHATTYLIVGANSRFEDYIKDEEARTGCFWVRRNE